jgi:predicted nucleotidyltransferase
LKKQYIIETSKDVIERLLLLDREIGMLSISNKVKIAIFGGAAFLLRGKFRPTSDIDVYLLEQGGNNEFERILNKYDINTRIKGVMEVPCFEDFSGRLDLLKVPFDHLEVYVASAYDLIISKIFSSRGDKDVIDLVRSDLLDQVDLKKLWELYYEAERDTLLRPERYNSLDEILDMRREYKKGV